VSFTDSAASVDTKAYAADAVSHALQNFVLPVGTLGKYLRRVASGLAREGQPPADVAQEAANLDVSLRSVYRWRQDPSGDLEGKAKHLQDKRMRAHLARLIAEKLAIDPSAARMRINRRLQKGQSLQQVATELLALEARTA
jgi:hypothetical protein